MELMTPQEAADFLKVTPRTVSIWLKEGKIPGFKLGIGKGAEWRINRDDLTGFLYANANEAQIAWEEVKQNVAARKSTEKKTAGRKKKREESGNVPEPADVTQEPDTEDIPVENPNMFDSRELRIAWDEYRKKRDIP